MEVNVTDRAKVWRGRGAPRTIDVPDNILQLLDRTYRTGQCGVIPLAGADPEEVAEVLATLRAGARYQGKRLREQRDEKSVRFEMVDKGAKRVRT